MKIFRATDLRIEPIMIIADDIQHASHTLLSGIQDGLGHLPDMSYSIGPWEPLADMAPEIIKRFADDHVGGLAHLVEGGWEVIRFDRHRTYP